MTGPVKWWNTEKGYGWIICDGQRDVFVHHSSLEGGHGDLREGQRCSFDVETNPRTGLLHAVRVKVI
jgi:CspA family cold shock protein